jgi:hypothetical protein
MWGWQVIVVFKHLWCKHVRSVIRSRRRLVFTPVLRVGVAMRFAYARIRAFAPEAARLCAVVRFRPPTPITSSILNKQWKKELLCD